MTYLIIYIYVFTGIIKAQSIAIDEAIWTSQESSDGLCPRR
ncbi:MAG: hypothetical protein U7123_19600 [Potamolinea sp.]